MAPPRIDLVVSKRLVFALRELEETGRLRTFPEGLSLNQRTLSQYLRVLLHSFETNDDLNELVDNLSGGNIRVALEFLSDFVGSGHVDSQKILGIYQTEGSYTVPVHEFLRAILYKDHEYYDPSVSRIANIFDITAQDGREHFLQAIIMSLVERLGRVGVDEGFIDVDGVFEFCQSKGFTPAQIHTAVDRAVAKKLLDGNPRLSGSQSIISVRITSIGAYTVKKLVGTFAYLDAVVIDTPIVSLAIRGAIGAVAALEDRLDRAELFKSYLSEQWEALNEKGLPFDWGAVIPMLDSDIAKVRKKQEQVKGGSRRKGATDTH